jgi:hypothetical protein
MGLFVLADGVTLTSLRVSGSIRIRKDIRTTGAQLYDGNVVIDPETGSSVSLTSSNANITFNGLLDGTAKATSSNLMVNAGTGTVTLGDSVGSVNPLGQLEVRAGQIIIKGDVLTLLQQRYFGDVTISDNGREGFLYDLFIRNTKPVEQFRMISRVKTRVFMSMDPLVEFNNKLDGDAKDIYSLLVASIFNGFTDTTDDPNYPIVSFKGAVGSIYPFYSANIQTLQFRDRLSTSLDIGGIINVTSGIQTATDQNYGTGQMNVFVDPVTLATTFKSSQTGMINFDVSKIGGEFNVSGTGKLIIDGETNFTGSGIGLTGVSKPVQEARAAAAANKSALTTTLKVNKLLRLNNDDAGATGEVEVAMGESIQVNDRLANGEECEEGSTQLACAR